MDLDRADSDILNAVTENARLSLRKIAKKIGLAPATVMTRLKRLEDSGIIKRYSAVIDYDKLGYDLPVIVNLCIPKEMVSKVGIEVAKHPSVIAVHDITGRFDVLVVARFRNRQALDAFLKHLHVYESIERSETCVLLNTLGEKPLLF
ncbi:MAG: Lrp/AsnC family transcriptional regulator [Candidatus Diapherotrites archaeon]